MSKFLVVIGRQGQELDAATLANAHRAFEPLQVGLGMKAPRVVRPAPDLAIITTGEPASDTAALSGVLLDGQPDRYRVGTGRPEGAFSLVRWDNNTVEMITDMVASRPLWHARDEQHVLASNSQLAIVRVLGGFEPNGEALSWFLSSGTLGPYLSWDSRVSQIPPHAIVSYSRVNLASKTDIAVHDFAGSTVGEEFRSSDLHALLTSTFDRLPLLGQDGWRVSLSGGYDSRLNLLHSGQRRAITHGRPGALDEPNNDASVAAAVAKSVGAELEYMSYDLTEFEPRRLFEDVILAGEARTSNYSGCVDGLESFRRIAAGGATGLIRGDEAFGWLPTSTDEDVRRGVGLTLLSEYYPTSQLDRWQVRSPELPEAWKRAGRELRENWRDRLYQTFRLPLFISPLTDMVEPFLDVANPLLCNGIVEYFRDLSPKFRTDKLAIRKFAKRMEPQVPFASSGALPAYAQFSSSEAFGRELHRVLESAAARRLFSAEFIDDLVRTTQPSAQQSQAKSLPRSIARRIPKRMRSLLRLTVAKPRLHPRELALRAYIAVRVHSLFLEGGL